MKYFLTLIFIFFLNIGSLFSQKITFILNSNVGANNSNYFFASNLNGWSPNDTSYKFSKLSTSEYSLTINDFKNINHIEYKITKGNWQSVECNIDGSPIQNRYFIVNKINTDTTIYIKVDYWRDGFDLQHPKSTASKNVKILSNDFYLKSLGVKRRIWIYLPNGYDSSKEKYKVLYMHDGQNLFDVLTGPFGEWGVDESLDTLNKNLIVVGIDNGSAERLSEYSAFDFKVNADAKNVWDVKAKGKLYLESLVNDLMPYVESNYRVKKGKENTFIAGSSMGGLISYYALFLYPDKFSKAGVFSPSFWVAKDQYSLMTRNHKKKLGDIYMLAGELEGRTYIADMYDIHEIILEKALSENIVILEVENAQHNEQFWRSQYAKFIQWLL